MWLPGHTCILLNESADWSLGFAIGVPILNVCPNLAAITVARHRRYFLLRGWSNAILHRLEYAQMNSSFCVSRQCELALAGMRCRLPKLTLYLNRSGLALTDACLLCNQSESLEHYLFECRRFTHQRKRYHTLPFERLRLKLKTSVLFYSVLAALEKQAKKFTFSFTNSSRLPEELYASGFVQSFIWPLP